jgi:hypothetical protein
LLYGKKFNPSKILIYHIPMSEIISIPFVYAENRYTALVNIKKQPALSLLNVTIMDGALETLLFGFHVFEDTGEGIFPKKRAEAGSRAAKLQTALEVSLNHHFYPVVAAGEISK